MISQLRRWLARGRLHRKILVINVLATLLAALLGGMLISWGAWVEERDRVELDALTRARIIADSASAALVFRDTDSVASMLSVLRFDSDVVMSAIYDESGKAFLIQGNKVQPPLKASGNLPGEGMVQQVGQYLDVWVPVLIDGQVFGTLLIREKLTGLYERIAALLGIVLAGSLVAAGLSAYLVHRFLPRLLSPLSELSLLMQQVTRQDDYSQRAEARGNDEVGELADSFNHMIDRIEHNNQTLIDELLQRREVESKLDRLAHYDNVTQLTNRHYFEHRLHALLGEARLKGFRVALLFVDLDNFKDVNDSFGHHVGDVLLRSVASRIRHTLRAEDEISRLGGDEFGLLLTRVNDRDQIDRVAQKILHALAQPISIEDREIFVGLSLGSVLLPDDTDEFHSALRFADMAMYHAKHAGKNNHQFYRQALSEEQGQRLELESELRHALDRAELEMFFQPISKMNDDHQLLGAEALIRWHHPQRGLVGPDEFIPLAEETGLIVRMGEWALREACLEAVGWPVQPGSDGLFVSVNLSPRQLSDVHILTRISSALNESGLPASRLELELTESILADQSSQTVQTLMAIAELGVRLVLDDFGTGYSSLAYLKHFPIAKLKIDRGFVMELPSNLDDKSICDAVIGLGKSLDVTVLAEGVETREQAAMLANMGCQQAQGYYFSRPIPAEAFRHILP